MLRWQKKLLRMTYVVLDVVMMLISVIISIQLAERWLAESFRPLSGLEIYGYVSIIALMNLLVFLFVELYDSFMESPRALTGRLLLESVIAFAAGHFLSYGLLMAVLTDYRQGNHLLFSVIFFVISTCGKVIYHRMRSNRNRQAENVRNVLLVGQSPNGVQYVEAIRRHQYLNYRIIGFLHIKYPPGHEAAGMDDGAGIQATRDSLLPGKAENGDRLLPECSLQALIYGPLPHLGGLDELEDIINRQVVDEVVVTRSLSYDQRLEPLLKTCQERGITITMLLKRQNYHSAQAMVTMIDDIPAVKFHTVSLNEEQLLAKRLLDIMGSLVGMVIFGIAWLVIAPLIKLESSGPVIFTQDRVGKNGRVFKIRKFRSMCNDAEAKKRELQAKNEMRGHMFKMTNDPRVTRIGAFLRKTSLDELPQFYNVLKGDMSLVGTRPPTVAEVEEYQTHHYKRISVIPGITGMWQISGRSAVIDFEEVVKLDNAYIANWTVWRDIKIIAKTVIVVLQRRGSH
ncbi:sugar transferase [Anoxynatronum buryatiense]|uniref:Exopolysaccharide biosynthesis polyprenyl glycosylphosphotransferase n=1 Tax=Anoxynatronum buryatiense TaxID=489973 RepID=A0AA45WVQ4_9CLOT|nr:sugar transferase [Anoxynatronum buryatiense]SMP54887.1 exopolysaccharide biosynthesis polyprenyl glycosylphosphotransferase [Anoxynatronum buryatiense]